MRPLLLLSALAFAACEGSLAGGVFGTGRPDDPRPVDPTKKEPLETPGPSSRLPRLNNTEYENTVTDLLHLPAKPNVASTFVTDTTSSTFDTNGALLNVDATSWSDYQRAAEQLAATATSDAAALRRTFGGTVPADPPAQVTELARRAWRRPPTAAEVTALVTLYGRAAALTPNVATSLGGPRLVLEALLQSPHFLYRPELATDVKDGVVPLDPYEVATRLSYALWRTMPDEALFTAAASGELSTQEGYLVQARRLLADPRARDTVASFHDQLLQVQKVNDVTRNTTLFPEFSPALRGSMAEEQRAFVRHVVLDQRAGLSTLLTAPYSFLDANTARVYGNTGVTSLSKVTFTDGKRSGLLTQLGFLATNATSTTSDPIHRGTFVNHQLLCSGLPPPPNMVPALPSEDPMVVRTLRQRVEAFTGKGTCGEGCHSTFINPVGFAYENYDALGRWRDTEKSLPIDATGEFMFDETLERYTGSAEFGKKLAESKAAHACYFEHWLEYLYGHRLTESERPLVTRLAKQSRESDAAVMGLLEELVASDAFRARAVEGVTP
ncbi:MAG: DUF1592 domain-containing protein [Myxococcales bacterium]|nr:DUF1592 domain-containing protein [Myxococcales bacterium]